MSTGGGSDSGDRPRSGSGRDPDRDPDRPRRSLSREARERAERAGRVGAERAQRAQRSSADRTERAQRAQRSSADRTERAQRAQRSAGSRRSQRPRRSQSDSAGSGGQRSDFWSRILVAVPAAIIAIVFIDLGGLAWALFMIAIGAVCMYELYGLLDRWRPAPAVGFASLAAMVVAARYGTTRGVLEIGMATLPAVFLVVMARGQRGAATVSMAGTLFGVYWIAFAFAHAELLRRLPHGGGILIDILIGTFLADTAAYLGGRLFGRRPLAPAISPNKTVEGLLIGMAFTVASVWFAGRYQDWLPGTHALVLGLGVAVFAPIGDLFESFVKRQAGAKDTGALLGAHGGMLDRLDAVLFTAVVGYYVWLAYV
jgi:phosphatidate cytidylyltransferase